MIKHTFINILGYEKRYDSKFIKIKFIKIYEL